MPAFERTSKTGITADQIKSVELYGKLIRGQGEAADFSDPAINDHLFTAEDFYERYLQIKLAPTRVFSNPQLRATSPDPAVKTDFDPTKDIAEPAYDYQNSMFQHNRWSNIELNYRPVRSVTQCFFWFPGTTIGASWRLANDWLRLDYKFGTQQIVPASGILLPMLSLNAYVIGALAGGRDVPQSIFIDYVVGFESEELQRDHYDLLRGIRLLALLLMFGLLTSVRSAGMTGRSLGLDGLSRSNSFGGKYGAYSGEIELAIANEKMLRENWQQQEQSVICSYA
jgi:hypothetical protein